MCILEKFLHCRKSFDVLKTFVTPLQTRNIATEKLFQIMLTLILLFEFAWQIYSSNTGANRHIFRDRLFQVTYFRLRKRHEH